jgi:heptosyltransferase I
MRVLIIKMSSLGDVLHTFPALTDAQKAIPNIQFDWVVETDFADLPPCHPAVNKVIPIAFREMRKQPLSALLGKPWKQFKKTLQSTHYDLVIDAQGLIKSGLITWLAKGKKTGLDKASLREPLARFAYHEHHRVDPTLHAIARVRQLFASALGYAFHDNTPEFGLDRNALMASSTEQAKTIMLLHGTTWDTKLWPEAYWCQLTTLLKENGFKVVLPWGSSEEKARAERIATHGATVLPKQSLSDVMRAIANMRAIVAVDTGLGHVAAAFGVPMVSLYGPTDPLRTGAIGHNQVHLSPEFACAPCLKRQCHYQGDSEEKPACFTTLAPDLVFQTLKTLMDKSV